MTDVAGRVAFVTGGASGIGLATARALAARGADLILADIDAAALAPAADSVREQGGRVLTIPMDVTSAADWAAAGEAARAFGPVSLLISNAGVGGGAGAFETYDPAVWHWAYGVNAHAHLHACRTFLGAMKESRAGGHLLFTSSMVAIVPPPISVAYISSKAATLGIALALRNELEFTRVRVSVLMPGMAATRIVENTRRLRPGAQEDGGAAATSAAMQQILSGGMDPARIADRAVRAIEGNEFWVFTHPEWKVLAGALTQEMLDAMGVSADPAYPGDDIEALVAANHPVPANDAEEP